MVALPAAAAENHAVAVAAQIATILTKVLSLQGTRRHIPRAARVVHNARFSFTGCSFGQEREKLFGEKEMREVVSLHLDIIS